MNKFKIQACSCHPPIAMLATILDVAYNRSLGLLIKHMVDSKWRQKPRTFCISFCHYSIQVKSERNKVNQTNGRLNNQVQNQMYIQSVADKAWKLCTYWISNILVGATENSIALACWTTGFQNFFLPCYCAMKGSLVYSTLYNQF